MKIPKQEIPAVYLQCPQCGSISFCAVQLPVLIVNDQVRRYGYQVYCQDCNFSTDIHHGPERARKEWNSYIRTIEIT